MPLVTLRPQTLKKLAPGPDGKRVSYRDDECRGLLLRVGGKDPNQRVFYFEYSFRGESRRLRLGDIADDVTLTARRAEVDELRALVSRGVDPLEERRRVEKAAVGGEPFAKLAARALASLEATVRPATLAEYKRLINKELIPALGDVNAEDPLAIKRAVLKLGDKLVERAPYIANRTVQLARRILSFAVSRDRDGRYPANPLLRVAVPLREEVIKTRVYNADEVRAIVAGCKGTLLEDAVPLLLATGARAGEVFAARWPEFDLSTKTWNIPAANSKIGHDRPVHLNRVALDILKRVAAKSEKDGFLFPGRGESQHRERQQKLIEQIREKCGVKDFALHDLRRVVRSGLSDLGAPSDVSELALGHLPPKLVRRYSPHPSFWLLAEQRKVVEAWGARLTEILANEKRGGKVLPLVRVRR